LIGLAISIRPIIITEIFVEKGGRVTNATNQTKHLEQDEIPTLPAPDEEMEGVSSTVPPIPRQSDVRKMASLSAEAVETSYEAITKADPGVVPLTSISSIERT